MNFVQECLGYTLRRANGLSLKLPSETTTPSIYRLTNKLLLWKCLGDRSVSLSRQDVTLCYVWAVGLARLPSAQRMRYMRRLRMTFLDAVLGTFLTSSR